MIGGLFGLSALLIVLGTVYANRSPWFLSLAILGAGLGGWGVWGSADRPLVVVDDAPLPTTAPTVSLITSATPVAIGQVTIPSLKPITATPSQSADPGGPTAVMEFHRVTPEPTIGQPPLPFPSVTPKMLTPEPPANLVPGQENLSDLAVIGAAPTPALRVVTASSKPTRLRNGGF